MVRATKLLPEVKSHYGDLQNYVGGAWRTPQATEWIEDTNPATGRVIARVPLWTKEDVDVAVQEAFGAWDVWRETPPLDRARYFFTLRDLMDGISRTSRGSSCRTWARRSTRPVARSGGRSRTWMPPRASRAS